MKRTSFILTIAGLLLGSFGLVMFNFGGEPKTTSAAGSYASTWQATKILTVSGVVGGLAHGEVGIGVWQWEVNGTINNSGTTSFSETWDAPPTSGINFTTSAHGCSISNVDTMKILAGCFADQDHLGGPDTSRYYFSIRDVNGHVTEKWKLNAGSGEQDTTSCYASPRNSSETECLFQSGSYSFQHVYEPGHNARQRWVGGGTFMPLFWTVTGTIS